MILKKIFAISAFVFLGSASIEMGEEITEKDIFLKLDSDTLKYREIAAQRREEFRKAERNFELRKKIVLAEIKKFLDSDFDTYEDYTAHHLSVFRDLGNMKISDSMRNPLIKKLKEQEPKTTRTELQDFLEHEAESLPLNDFKWRNFKNKVEFVFLYPLI